MRLGSFESGSQKPLGVGDEKETFVNPTNTKEVISVIKGKEKKDTPNKLKGTFYLTKIVHLLLPQHVPDIYQAGESIDGQQTFDRERVAHTPGHALLQKERLLGIDSEEAGKKMIQEMGTEMSEVALELESIGLGFNIDENVGNYTRSEQGDVNYLEIFAPWEPKPGQPDELELLFDKEALLEAIGRVRDEKIRGVCKTHFERLLTLFEEEKKAHKEMYRARLRDTEPEIKNPEIKNIETLFTTFETNHNLELLLAIQTEKEAMESSERSAAKKDLSLILSQLKTLGTGTTITTEQLLELHKKYDTLSRAVGIINSGRLNH
ncbi:hypothetical protein IPJ70_00440 [Candidatus Campbellbacteria bacterium]|nr:MAG: hypothetical protein IPJ70_00440 [Candidatus Campbellbacteria bacterium]